MRAAAAITGSLLAAGLAAAGGSTPAAASPGAGSQKPPVEPCSLLTGGQAAKVLGVKVHVQPGPLFCTYQGTKNQVLRAVVITPQRISRFTVTSLKNRYGPTVMFSGAGYRGQATNSPPSTGAAGLAQSTGLVISGKVAVRVFVTYHGPSMRGKPQMTEAVALSKLVAARLVHGS